MEQELKQFIEYVYSFYGTGGVYAEDFNGGCTMQQIRNACYKYFNDVYGTESWGGGDSFDREYVRQILDPSYSIV